MNRLLHRACLAVPVALFGGPVLAYDFCVTCSGPEAHYTCRLDLPSVNPRDLRLQLLCISQLAQGGGHARCEIDHPQNPPCRGDIKAIAIPGETEPAPQQATDPATPAVPAGDPAAGNQQPPAGEPPPAHQAGGETVIPKSDKAPETVKEMVEKGAVGTGKNLEEAGGTVKGAAKSAGGWFKKAGSAVGGAAKKTWTCLSSFFGDC